MKKVINIFLLAVLFVETCGCSDGGSEKLFTYISTIEDLYKISEEPSGNYTLKNDIVFSEEDLFSPLCSLEEPFSGILDGNGYCIRNLNIMVENTDNDTVYVGLFQCVSGATIKNLGVVGGKITVASCDKNTFVGAFAGFSMAKSEDGVAVLTSVTNCYTAISVDGDALLNGKRSEALLGVGGFLGAGCANFNNCYSQSRIFTYNINANQSLGGFVGQPRTFEGYSMELTSCYSSGAIVGRRIQGRKAGAFVGHSFSTQFIEIDKSYYLSHHEEYAGFECAFSGATDESFNGVAAIEYENFSKKESFDDFDFNNRWSIADDVNGGYPYLKSQKT